MSLRRSLLLPLLSFCTFACQAQQDAGTSIGQGPPPPSPPGVPEPNSEEPGANPGVSPGNDPDPGGFVDVPLTPGGGGGNVNSDAGQPNVETVVNADCAQTKVTATDTTELIPADIIIAVDTSGSMGAEAEFVQANLNRFSQQIIDSGIDARVILLATPAPATPVGDAGVVPPGPGGGRGGGGAFGGGGGFGGGFQTYSICIDAPLGSGNCPDDTNLPGFVHVNQQIGSRDALNKFIDSFPQWREHLRPNSIKAFLVISDDDATDRPNNSAEAFTQNLEALAPELFERWNMNAVYSFTMCDDLAAAVGAVYRDLVAQTGGVEGDLCEQDFQPVFDKLATQIVENAGAELICEWDIPPAVNGQTFSTELVKVQRTSESGEGTTLTRVDGIDKCSAGGWYFDDNFNPAKIIACEATCDAMQDDSGGGIDVSFGCEIVEGCAASEEAALSGADNGCEWPLPTLADSKKQLNLDNVNVRYTTENGFGVLMGKVANPEACEGAVLGWHFDDAKKPSKIVACPATCDVLTSRNITRVNALFGCETKPARPVL
jgi:hypothetical protein